VVFDQFEDAAPAKPLERFGRRRSTPYCTASKAMPMSRCTARGNVLKSLRLEPIHTKGLGAVAIIHPII
jgi:hypothetical protein